MCGLTGFFLKVRPSYNPINTIQRMTDLLAHRGPDHDDIARLDWTVTGNSATSAYLGHRRLKIQDLSQDSNQPYFNKDRSKCMVYNGEIYNFCELRSELKSMGWEFETHGDTEVVLSAYEAWGEECFERFNGMWALCIVDTPKKTAILSRDRMGEKPLYYYSDDSVFVFGSEIKSILAHPAVPAAPNLERIYRYISTSYRYGDIFPDSFFEGIFQIPSGCYLSYDLNSKPTIQRYWSLSASKLMDEDPQYLTRQFLELFTDSVRLRLRSDTPVGSMLSGGLDSTSVTSVARKILNIPVQSFSGIMSNEPGAFNEGKYIESVSSFTGISTTYIQPEPTELVDTVKEMIEYFDEPICTVTWYAAFLLCRNVSAQSIPVILNGHGGDEIMAGYWDHYQYYFFDLQESGDTKIRKSEIKHWFENHHRNPKEIQQHEAYWHGFISGKLKEIDRFPNYQNLFSPRFPSHLKRPINLNSPFQSSLTRRLFLELFHETTPAILKAEDRSTMAHSIESRTPFLDHRLVEFCFSLPSSLKIQDGMGKWILRNSMKGILPEDVRMRKEKVGFNAPSHTWFRKESRMKLKRLLSSKEFRSRGLLRSENVLRIFDDHLANRANHQMVLWQILNLELWFQKYFPDWSLD